MTILLAPSNAAPATWRNGKAVVLPAADGSRVWPAVVASIPALDGAPAQTIVGSAAVALAARHPGAIVAVRFVSPCCVVLCSAPVGGGARCVRDETTRGLATALGRSMRGWP